MAACTSLGLMMMKRWTKSGYTVLLGKPRRQILMPSNTPLQVSWGITRAESSSKGVLWLLGTMHRMKWGSVELRVFSKDSSWDLKAEDTVLKTLGPASFPFFFSFETSSGWQLSSQADSPSACLQRTCPLPWGTLSLLQG